MQLIIGIPEHIYEHAKEGSEDSRDEFDAMRAIANGSPLPKGHGVLKDVTNLMRGLYTDMQTDEMMFTSSEVYKLIDEECPTIIEADKEAQE